MKLARKLMLNIVIVTFIFGGIFAVFVLFGVNPLARELEHAMGYELTESHADFQEAVKVKKREESIKNIVLVIVPILIIAYAVFLWIYVKRNIIRPLERAGKFSHKLAAGNFPTKLTTRSSSDEVVTLTKALNFLRDRLHTTIMKLEKSHKREKSARRGAEKASNLKSNFLSKLSPELRTPLNSINGYVEVIRRDLSKGCYDRLLSERIENIARNAEILNRQVANLLDIGKLGGEQKYLNVSEFETGAFIRELLEYSMFCLQEKDITLVNHLSSNMPEKINTDRHILSLILSTLIRAVARVSRPGEIISCGCELVEDKLIFWIRDNKRSEPYEKLAPLFKRLVPDSDFSNTATPAVLNMMLAATKAASIGAELDAHSSDDAECEFTLTFQAWDVISESSPTSSKSQIVSNYANQDNDVFDEHDDSYDVVEDFKLEAEMYSDNIKVLLAEDDKDNADVLNTLLTADGAKVDVVDNGVKCIEKLGEKNIDVLILSLFLPETDVFELIKNVRKEKKRNELPIIVMTGYLSQSDRQKLIVAGVNRCFIKPLNFQQLRQMVKVSKS